jgi:hypothetical protein
MSIVKECRMGLHLFDPPTAPEGERVTLLAMKPDARCYCGETTWASVNVAAVPFADSRTKRQRARDVHVFKREDDGRPAAQARGHFFRQVSNVVLDHDTDAGWLLQVEFLEGGKLVLVRGSDPCWIEPERH